MVIFLRNAGLLSLFAAIVTFAVVGFWRPGLFLAQKNFGHQLGGDLCADISGNTIEALRANLQMMESSNDWQYAECDVRETRDHHLVVFHDWDISKVPNSEVNQRALGAPVRAQPICELTLEQIQGLKLECGCGIPTLEEVLQAIVVASPTKPLLLEIKYLHSNQGRTRLTELARQYRDNSDTEIHFLAFIRNLQRSFPDPTAWLKQCHDAGFCVYQVYRPKTKDYDLCETWQ